MNLPELCFDVSDSVVFLSPSHILLRLIQTEHDIIIIVFWCCAGYFLLLILRLRVLDLLRFFLGNFLIRVWSITLFFWLKLFLEVEVLKKNHEISIVQSFINRSNLGVIWSAYLIKVKLKNFSDAHLLKLISSNSHKSVVGSGIFKKPLFLVE